MDFLEICRKVLLAAGVALPVLLVSVGLMFLVTRTIEESVLRRRYRWLLGVWCVLAATATGAHFFAWLGNSPSAETLVHIRKSLTLPLLLYLLLLFAVGLVNRRIQDGVTRQKLRKSAVRVFVVLLLLWLANVWLVRESVDYGAMLGVLGAGLALSLSQVLLCATGWVALQINHQFDVGDRVQIGEIRGDVCDIAVLHTTLVEIGAWTGTDEFTGRMVTVPNSAVFTQNIYNYTAGFQYIWSTIRVVVTYESNWRKAQQLMLGAVKESQEGVHDHFRTQVVRLGRKFTLPFREVAPTAHPAIVDSGVELALRYLTEPRKRRDMEAELTGKILDAFAAEPDICLAYPTTRFYDASREAKPKT